MSSARKYAIVLPDGAADEPVAALNGRTPLEAAHKPNIDWIARNGLQGCVTTTPAGYSPGSDIATMSLLGYDPRVNHPGRAPLEAAAKGLNIDRAHTVFRCNLVTIVDGLMEDFTAGHISQVEADRLIADLNVELESLSCRFHPGVSYRNLMVAPFGEDPSLICTPPHDIPRSRVSDFLPRGPESDRVRNVMARSHSLLADHDVNLVRRDLGENPATHIWLWGQGRPQTLPPFATRFGISAAVIAAVDLIRGLAVTLGMEWIDVPGATGYLDTDYSAKGKAAVSALDWFDLVIVHVEAPDEAGHLGDAGAKITAIERIDQHIVGPLLEKLRTFESWKIMIAPDHPTPVEKRVHTAAPPPFCIAGHGAESRIDAPFSEANASARSLRVDPGHELMDFFLNR